MEYRFFFPLFLEEEEEKEEKKEENIEKKEKKKENKKNSSNWINKTLQNEYKININSLISYFESIIDNYSTEKRTDEYYVGSDYIGVKNRDGKKMEVKIRQRVSSILPGAEFWVKQKLGKGDLYSYEQEINNLLSSNQLPPDTALFERNLICEVSKKRNSGVILGIGFEFTRLKLKFQSNIPFNKRKWISISFESSSDNLLKSLLQPSTPVFTYILPVITTLYSIFATHTNASLSNLFFPIISGYPAWLHSIVSPEHVLSSEILSPIQYLMNHYNVSIPSISISTTSPTITVTPTTFDWSYFPTLETSRLVLHEIKTEHFEDIFQIRSNFEVTRYNIGKEYQSIEQGQQLVESMIDDFNQKKSLRWGICKKLERNDNNNNNNNNNNNISEIIGMVGFNYWNTVDHRGSIGFDLKYEEWGHGYMSEAVSKILQFGFETMNLNRIEAMASEENEKSLKLLSKLGFVIEGIQREQYYEDEIYHNLVMLSILKSEWNNSRK